MEPTSLDEVLNQTHPCLIKFTSLADIARPDSCAHANENHPFKHPEAGVSV
jgi:hypothetical protein